MTAQQSIGELDRQTEVMAMSRAVRAQVDRVVGVWEIIKPDLVGEMPACILAAGACGEALTRLLGDGKDVKIEPVGCNLTYVDPATKEERIKVAHPENGSSPIVAEHANARMIGYHGHVVLALTEGGQRYLVDPDLGVVALWSVAGFASKMIPQDVGPPVQFLWRSMPSQDFAKTDAWASRAGVAQRIMDTLDAHDGEQGGGEQT